MSRQRSEKVQERLDYLYLLIYDYLLEHRYPPSMEELAEKMGVVKSTVLANLIRLKNDGRIDFVEGLPRTITVPELVFVNKEKVMIEDAKRHTEDAIGSLQEARNRMEESLYTLSSSEAE